MPYKIIAERLKIDQDDVTDKMHLVNDLGADSLNIVEIVMDIESEYGIEIADEDAEKLETVGQIRHCIEDYT